MRFRATLVVIAALLFAAVGTVRGQQIADSNAPIRLKAGTFTPSLGQQLPIPNTLADARVAASGNGYYLLQFRGPVQQSWKAKLTALGAEVLDYIPENAFKVRMNADLAGRAAQLAEVSYVGQYYPAYKVSPDLKQGAQLVRIQVERGADRNAVALAAVQSGFQVAAIDDKTLVAAADQAGIATLATIADVAWIEAYTLNITHNEYGAGQIIGTGVANTNGYDGSSQIAAVADTGLGGGTITTAHPDIPSTRITAIQNFPGVTDSCFQAITDDGAVDVDSGHGTHVAGSVLSDGDAVGRGKGGAPAAHLVFQSIENYVTTSALCKAVGNPNGYYLTGLNNLSNLFLQAYNAGARVHSNSWGSSQAGLYTANSVTTDQFIWDHKDMAITFSAGNSGADANADGVVDNDSIGSPATAKNVITVGASENDRQGNYACDTALAYTSRDTAYQLNQTCNSMGGQNLLGTPRQRWGFTANPIADDPTAGNAQQMAAFSSRGPTDDGRIKPDVVAPGTWVLSTYSSQFQEGYGTTTNPRTGNFQSDGWGIPVSSGYKYFGGTSMANPIVAGGAVVVRDFYQKGLPSVNASAALVKATLINSAVDLLDENNDGLNDNDFPIPNVHEGWGRVDIANATDGSALFVDNATGLATGGSTSFNYSTPGGQPFKVTLVWSDFPSTTAATINLVNNLNLTVTGPGGVTYRGNVFSGGWSATGGVADTINNVENVYVQSAAAGTWTVTISGANIPQGPQPFALVVNGGTVAAPPTPTPTPLPTLTPTPGPALPAAPSNLVGTAPSRTSALLTWTDNSNNETSFEIERCSGSNTCTSFALVGTVGANTTSFTNTSLTRGTRYRYRVRAVNTNGGSAYSNIVNVRP